MYFEEIYKELKLQELEGQLQNLTMQTGISFSEILKEVYQEKGNGVVLTVWDKVKECIHIQWEEINSIFITIVIVILLSSLFSSFKDIFQNAQIADISFYISYLLLVVIFTNVFGSVLQMGEETLKNIKDFMGIFFPTFFLVVGSTAGVGTGMAYYQVAGLVIYFVECFLLSILLPAISSYMLFVLMNGIWEEERLTLLLELFRKGIRFLLKVSLGILTGAGMLPSMVIPIVDRVKGETIYKAVESIPGIGEAAEGALRIWLGSAVLIKNSVGIVGCIFLLVLCMMPIIKVLIIGSVFKITAAILSVAGEKKMINCVNHVGDGMLMVLQVMGYGILFFVVLIALSIYTTNGGV